MSRYFSVYQHQAAETAIYPEAGTGSYNAVSYATLGLANEAGEVAGKLKKVWRDKGGVITEEEATAIAAELGDVLWYLAVVAKELRIDLGDIAQANVEKLRSRQARGVLGGSGDDR